LSPKLFWLSCLGDYSQFGSSLGLSVLVSVGFGLAVSSLGLVGFSVLAEASVLTCGVSAGSSAEAMPMLSMNIAAIAKDMLLEYFMLSPFVVLFLCHGALVNKSLIPLSIGCAKIQWIDLYQYFNYQHGIA
jgi:hypothetical protein